MRDFGMSGRRAGHILLGTRGAKGVLVMEVGARYTFGTA
jgi:hypothetical protein